jgi:hypothetical protein
VWLEGLGKLKTFNDLIRSRPYNLPACSIMPHRLQNSVPNASKGHSIAQTVSRWLPRFEPGLGHVGFVVEKQHWSRLSLSTSVSPAKHSTDCFTLIIIWC